MAAQGELDVTVFRPSVIFGLGDSFLTMFASVLRKAPFFPLGFGQARFQPVWAADVADAFVDCLEDPATFGQAYELVGPKTYTLRELVEYTAGLCGSSARIIPLSEGWAYLQAGLTAARSRYGSIEDYLRRGVGLSSETIERLRAKLVSR